MPDDELLTQDLSNLNSLIPHVAVLGSNGTILATNDSWNRFAQENGAARMTAAGPGANYLSVCRRAASEGVSGAEAALEGIRGVLEGHSSSIHLEYPCHSLIGERWFLMSVSPLTGPTGGAVVTHVDITDRKLAELAVLGSELSLLDSPPHSIVGVGADGKIALVSGDTLKMFGYSRAELLGQPLEILVPESARMHHVRHRQNYFDDMLTRPVGLGLILEGHRKDGTDFPVEIGLSAIEGAAGTLAVAFVTDITRRRQLEQAAQRQIEADLAKEKLETVGALAQGIAHDFNNILAGVLAHAELAQAEIAEGSNPAEELRKIQTAVMHGTELVRQLMIYAGQETQALEPKNGS